MTSLADYVLTHYSHLMTPEEHAVVRHLSVLYKWRGEPPGPGTASDSSDITTLRRRWLSDDPAVVAAAQAGWDQARDNIAQRIVRDHGNDVYLNRCPACGALTRTPRARLCLTCGHTWFHIPRDQRT